MEATTTSCRSLEDNPIAFPFISASLILHSGFPHDILGSIYCTFRFPLSYESDRFPHYDHTRKDDTTDSVAQLDRAPDQKPLPYEEARTL